MNGILRTFRFMTRNKKAFGHSYTTIRELENFILNFIPNDFHKKLLIKNNNGKDEPRLKTKIKEFNTKNPLLEISYINIVSEAFNKLNEANFCSTRDKVKRNNEDDIAKWLMLIPKNVALTYIKDNIKTGDYIQCSDEFIEVEGYVEFSTAPLKSKPGGLFKIEDKKSDNNVVSLEDTIETKNKKNKRKMPLKNHNPDIQLFNNSSLNIGAKNNQLLGNPQYVKLSKFENKSGFLIVQKSNGSGLMDKKVHQSRYSFSPGKEIENFLNIEKIQSNCYYEVRFDDELEALIYNFNNIVFKR